MPRKTYAMPETKESKRERERERERNEMDAMMLISKGVKLKSVYGTIGGNFRDRIVRYDRERNWKTENRSKNRQESKRSKSAEIPLGQIPKCRRFPKCKIKIALGHWISKKLTILTGERKNSQEREGTVPKRYRERAGRIAPHSK